MIIASRLYIFIFCFKFILYLIYSICYVNNNLELNAPYIVVRNCNEFDIVFSDIYEKCICIFI